MNNTTVGMIDADLLDGGTRFPNLALMKLSAWHKARGYTTALLTSYDKVCDYKTIYISKVFTKTKVPPLRRKKNLYTGGTGFYEVNAPSLPNEIEHIMPDYTLYDDYVAEKISQGIPISRFDYYQNYSIGFTSRGCFRKCAFCVNRRYDHASLHSPVAEFFAPERKRICLLDDNIFACVGWRDVFASLKETGRSFQFKQGLDLRLITPEKARVLAAAKYYGEVYFAFDRIEDKDEIVRSLRIYRANCDRSTRAYVLGGFVSQDMNDLESVFERIAILIQYRIVPYIMRFASVYASSYAQLYSYIAAWCNQPNMFKKLSFGEFCEKRATSEKAKRECCWRVVPTEFLNLRYGDK